MTKKNIDLVIARYKEKIDWLYDISDIDTIKKVYIYEKSNVLDISEPHPKWTKESLPNLGRESHTYLHHIIKNYKKLNEFTIFLQGEPYEHSINLKEQICSINTETTQHIYPLNHTNIENEKNHYRHHPSHPHGLYLAYFMDLLFDINLDIEQTVKVSYGAQFCVPKHIILSRPLNFYKYLSKIVSRKQNCIEPYIFERLWLYIFDPNIQISDVYKIWI